MSKDMIEVIDEEKNVIQLRVLEGPEERIQELPENDESDEP